MSTTKARCNRKAGMVWRAVYGHRRHQRMVWKVNVTVVTVASDYRHALGCDGCGRASVQVHGQAPSFGQSHARCFVFGIRSLNDEPFKPIGHDLIALLNVDGEAPDIGHEHARTSGDVCSDVPGAASGPERDLGDLV